jgi:hypothetical protein
MIHPNDRHLIKTCALVSHSFLRPSRKQLFSDIIIGTWVQCENLHLVLTQNPDIRQFVRKLKIGGRSYQPLFFEEALLSILQLPLYRLEELVIFSMEPLAWNDLSSEMNDALRDIIRSSTLTNLTLHNSTNVPITLFASLTQLRTLKLIDVKLDFSDSERLYSHTADLPVGATRTSSYTGIERYIWWSPHSLGGLQSTRIVTRNH